jgi:formate transporter
MSYVSPPELVANLIAAGEGKLTTPVRETLVRAFMGGAFLALAAAFAITMSVQTGIPLIGAMLFPVGFCMIYLLGYDLLTGVFMLTPLAYFAGRPSVTVKAMVRNWFLVFIGNVAGAVTISFMMSIIFTFGFTLPPDKIGQIIAHIGESRTIGYAEHGVAGMLTLFTRAILCNWMVSTAVAGAMMSTTVSGKVLAMWMPIMLFFAMTFEHSVVNMFLFPSGLLLGAKFTLRDYLMWNELPTIAGNLFGGISFTAFTLYAAHGRNVNYTRSTVVDDKISACQMKSLSPKMVSVNLPTNCISTQSSSRQPLTGLSTG